MSYFKKELEDNIEKLSKDNQSKELTRLWFEQTAKFKYSYNFSWMGRPIIQYPQDMLAMQEVIWKVQPDLIIETGIAHGGSLIYYASLLELIGQDGEVLGIDIDIRNHNRIEIEKHTMFKRITMLEGSSISDEIISKVKEFSKKRNESLLF